MENIYRRTCFAFYKENDPLTGRKNIPCCKALAKIDCAGCPFFKEADEIKDNIFYPKSFESEDEYRRKVKNYEMKYGKFKDN